MQTSQNAIRPAMPSMPGRRRYVLAVLVWLGGLAAMGAILFTQLSGMGAGLSQVVVPGQKEIVLEPGHHTIFHERRSVVDGKVYEVNEVSGLMVRIVAPGGEAIELRPTTTNGTYSIGGREGQANFDFEIETPGTYVVSADYRGRNGPETVIAVGKDFVGGLVGTIFLAMAPAFAGFVLALWIGISTFLKRRRAKEAARHMLPEAG